MKRLFGKILGRNSKFRDIQKKVAKVEKTKSLPRKQKKFVEKNIFISDKKIIHKLWNVDDGRLVYVNYAYKIGGLKFVALLEAENGIWNIDRRSMSSYYRYGKKVKGYWRPSGKYYDFGFCQISNFYHPEITENPKFYTDWKWQIDQCLILYKKGTKFYGLKNIHKTKKRFKIL